MTFGPPSPPARSTKARHIGNRWHQLLLRQPDLTANIGYETAEIFAAVGNEEDIGIRGRHKIRYDDSVKLGEIASRYRAGIEVSVGDVMTDLPGGGAGRCGVRLSSRLADQPLRGP